MTGWDLQDSYSCYKMLIKENTSDIIAMDYYILSPGCLYFANN